MDRVLQRDRERVTLLLDPNLSHRLKQPFGGLFDEVLTVANLGMNEMGNLDIWRYARERGWALMSKDGDMAEIALLYGAPPKAIRLRIGNGPWRLAADVVLEHAEAVRAFLDDPEESLLILSRAE